MKIDRSEIKKILIIKLRGIGDVILSSVIFENLRKDFPNAKIDYLTEKPSDKLLLNLPLFNEIILFNRKKTSQRVLQLSQIRSRKYDLVLDTFSNPATALITFFSGAKYRAGFPYEGRKYAYNLYGPPERDKYHAAVLHLELLKRIGLSYSLENLLCGYSEKDLLLAKNFTSQNYNANQLVFGLSPSGGWDSKKCTPTKFAEIVKYIGQKYDTKVLLLWGPGDKKEAEEIYKLAREYSIFAPATSITEMAAFIKCCNLFIANDSGPMHIGTAVKTPTLSLHGPTSPYLQGPYGKEHQWVRKDELECIGCNLLECPKGKICFTDLEIEKISFNIEALLQKNNLQ